MDLYEFLIANGFKIPDKDKIGKHHTTLVVGSNKNSTTVGEIHRPSYNLPFDTITILYYLSWGQIEDALNFRDFLEKNNFPYEEKPSRKEIAKFLRKQAKDISSLADRL